MVDKKQYSSVTELITRLAPIWQDRVGLNHFEIEHVFLDSFFETDGADDFKVTAVTEVRWNYMLAKVKWYLPSAVRHSSDQLERTLVHELMHVLLAPEQALIDVKIEEYANNMTGAEADQLTDRFYECLELSTELATRAVMSGWKVRADPVEPG